MSEEHHDPDAAPADSRLPESQLTEPTEPTGPQLYANVPAEPANGEVMHVDWYEGMWMRLSTIILVAFLVAITVSAFVTGFQLPGAYQRIDPTTLYEEGSPFAEPQLRELAPGRYEVYIRAQIWRFTPEEIRIPVGSQVTFYVTSQDVQHGFKMVGTNINMMILPGQVSTLTATFDRPGTYNFICHEFCGQLHHTMYGRLVVEGLDDAELENADDAAGTALVID